MAANAGHQRVPAQGRGRSRSSTLIREHRVTHYCGAPIVHPMLINAPDELKQRHRRTRCSGLVARRAPPAAMIEGMERMGFDITHVYGLTETYGPATVCAKHDGVGRARRSPSSASATAARACATRVEEGMTVMDPETMQPVPADGETMGEIMFRGNITMKGYLKNPKATQEAFAGGWFHSGDLAVMQPDGYVKIKDRSKDIIISGGENISSLEVEDALYRHPAVLAAAVVAQPDPKWGETPCAFVELKPGATRHRDGDHRALPRAAWRSFKAPQRGGVRRAAEDLDRQDPEVRAAREGEVHRRHRHMSAVPQPDQPVLLREDRDGICTLTINRPQQMNLLTGEMLVGAAGSVRRDLRNDQQHPRGRSRRHRQGLLRRPRPEGDQGAQGAAEDRGAVRPVQPHDADHPAAAAAGDREGAGRRGRRRLPARRAVRPRGCRRGHEVRHQRRHLGLLLLDARASPSAATCSASTRWKCC